MIAIEATTEESRDMPQLLRTWPARAGPLVSEHYMVNLTVIDW